MFGYLLRPVPQEEESSVATQRGAAAEGDETKVGQKEGTKDEMSALKKVSSRSYILYFYKSPLK